MRAYSGGEDSFLAALHAGEASSIPMIVIGGGTNLIVSDRGYRGLVLRYRNDALSADGNRVTAGAGAELQRLVDFTIGRGLKGLEYAGRHSWLDRRSRGGTTASSNPSWRDWGGCPAPRSNRRPETPTFLTTAAPVERRWLAALHPSWASKRMGHWDVNLPHMTPPHPFYNIPERIPSPAAMNTRMVLP